MSESTGTTPDGTPRSSADGGAVGAVTPSDAAASDGGRPRQALLQDVVAAVTEQHSGDPLDRVEEALQARLAAAGLPPQPGTWVSATASEIAEGRHVVVDRHLAVGTGDGADGVPDEAGRPGA